MITLCSFRKSLTIIWYVFILSLILLAYGPIIVTAYPFLKIIHDEIEQELNSMIQTWHGQIAGIIPFISHREINWFFLNWMS